MKQKKLNSITVSVAVILVLLGTAGFCYSLLAFSENSATGTMLFMLSILLTTLGGIVGTYYKYDSVKLIYLDARNLVTELLPG